MEKYYKFDSGLTLLYITNKINKSTSIDICFDCGARCDNNIPGLSHFCEHMLFTGTDKLSKTEVSKRYFDFIKANAYTTNDEIYFSASIITERLGDYLTTVQDMICNSTFKKAAVEEEKKIVLQEIARDCDEEKNVAARLNRYELYGKQYFKDGVLGSKKTVSEITSKDVKQYIKKYFVKNNCTIAISSPLSFKNVKKLVKKNFDDLMPSNNLKPLLYDSDKLLLDEKAVVVHKNIDKNYFAVHFKFDRHGPDIKYRAMIGTVANMVGDFSEGLCKELRLDNSLVYSMGADFDINNVGSYFTLTTEVTAENLKPCMDVMLDYMKRLKSVGFNKSQLQNELIRDKYYFDTSVKTPSRLKNRALNYRFYKEFIGANDIHKQVQSIKLEELNKFVSELFGDCKIQVFCYGNATKKDVYNINQVIKKFN